MHHRFVDAETAGGVDDQDVVVVLFRPVQRRQGDVDRLVGGGGREEVGADLLRDGLQLRDSGRAVDVGRNGQDLFLFLFLQVLGEFTGGGRFTDTLQAGHQDDRRRLLRERQLGGLGTEVGAHQGGQLALHHADQGLARAEGSDDFFAQRFFLHFGDEFAHRRQRHVGLEQRQAHFAQHLGGSRLGVG